MSDLPKPNDRNHLKDYLLILAGLVLLTLISVGISRLNTAVGARVAICLLIALVQGGLSLAYLMHLNWEKRFIFGVLLLTVVFFLALLALPLLTSLDNVSSAYVP